MFLFNRSKNYIEDGSLAGKIKIKLSKNEHEENEKSQDKCNFYLI